MFGYRAALREALLALVPNPGQALLASYASPDETFVDVENAALYNVGASAYAHLMVSGLVCQRVASADGDHHLSYQLAPLPDLPSGRSLVVLEIEVPAVTSKPGPWWAAFRSAALRHTQVAGHEGRFAVDLKLPNSWHPVRVANALKPLLDGLISALHTHDGTNRDGLLPRLGVLDEPDTAWSMLCDPAFDLLGRRVLLRPYRTGLKWNPADDRCHAFRLCTEPWRVARVTAELSSMSA